MCATGILWLFQFSNGQQPATLRASAAITRHGKMPISPPSIWYDKHRAQRLTWRNHSQDQGRDARLRSGIALATREHCL